MHKSRLLCAKCVVTVNSNYIKMRINKQVVHGILARIGRGQKLVWHFITSERTAKMPDWYKFADMSAWVVLITCLWHYKCFIGVCLARIFHSSQSWLLDYGVALTFITFAYSWQSALCSRLTHLFKLLHPIFLTNSSRLHLISNAIFRASVLAL